MKRRTFIFFTIALGSVSVPFFAKQQLTVDSWSIIQQTQNILFPKQKDAPSADEFDATIYLMNVSKHPTFNSTDLKFLDHGAKELIRREKNFLKQDTKQQNQSIENFSKTTFGENWLSLLLFYTIEALVSDPIYGGNKNELGWKWLRHNAGLPRPKVKYGQL
jgi:gluconate 2-dehydrogenase gamma chain